MRRRKWWYIALSLAIFATCRPKATPAWEDIEIAPKVVVSIRPGAEQVQIKLHNGSGKDVVIDAPNSWNLSMTLEGEKHSLAIDPPEPRTRTTVAAGESREWEMDTSTLLHEYQPRPHGRFQARVWYDPNPSGSPKTFTTAITRLQAIDLR